jgi:hypothetical protein
MKKCHCYNNLLIKLNDKALQKVTRVFVNSDLQQFKSFSQWRFILFSLNPLTFKMFGDTAFLWQCIKGKVFHVQKRRIEGTEGT